MENVGFCLYYMGHPVELQLWQLGKHRLGFLRIYEYLQHHPKMLGVSSAVTGLEGLKKEFAVLSRAVHASSKSFRMTVDAKSTLLWSSRKESLGAWATRESACVVALNLLLLSLSREQLQGASHPQLRRAAALAVSARKRADVKKHLKITLPSPSGP